jgi:hypothetical protein
MALLARNGDLNVNKNKSNVNMHISDYDVVRHKFEMDFDKFNIALYSVFLYALR